MRNDMKMKNLVIKVLLMMSLFFLSLVVLNINLSNISKAEDDYEDSIDFGEWGSDEDEETAAFDKHGSALSSKTETAGKLSDAVLVGTKNVEHYKPGLKAAKGDSLNIGFVELRDYAEILCCQRGQHISSGGSFTVDYSNVPEGADETNDDDVLDPNSPAAQDYDAWDYDGDDDFTYPNGTTLSYEETQSVYTVKDSLRCIPQEAWVLSALRDGETPTEGYYSEEQQAWWMTPAGHTGSDMGSNDLYEEAVRFEDYIIHATESTKDGSANRLSGGEKTEEWNEYRRDPNIPYKTAGFNLTKPKWVTKGNIYNTADNGRENYKKPSVSFNADTKEYLVGPFAVDYYKSEFSNITSIELVLDNDNTLVLEFSNKEDRKKDFKIVLYDSEHDEFVKTDRIAPKGNQAFYLIMGTDKVSRSGSILQFNVNFEYTNADGTYQKLEGHYGKKARTVVYHYNETNPDNNTQGTHATVDTIDGGTLDSQRLALAGDAFRWKEIYSLRRQFNIKIAQVQITKKVVDEYGNTIDNDDLDEARFKFNVKGIVQDDAYRNSIDENDPSKSVYRNNFENMNFPPVVVTVGKDPKARTSRSKFFAWAYEAVADDSKIKNPTYEITEVFDAETVSADKYRLIKAYILDANGNEVEVPLGDDFVIRGEFQANKGITFRITNQKLEKKYGYLRIQKTMKEPEADEGARSELSEQIKNKEFKFNVKITGDFYINGVPYTENTPYTNPENKPITIKADGKYHYVMVDENGKEIPIIWYTKNAPKFELEELKDETGETRFSSDAKLTADGRYIISGELIGTTTTDTGNDFKPEPDEKNLTNISSASFENEYDESEGAKLRLIKEIDLSKFADETARDFVISKLKELDFTFKVTVDNKEEDVVLHGGDGKKNGTKYQITWVSDRYTWYKLDKRDHSYKIKEIKVPEGTSFVSFNGESGKTEVSGSLRNNDNVLNEITNTCINKIDTETTKIKLEKILGSVDNFDIENGVYKDESKEILRNRDYYFYVDIKGRFSYGENLKYGDHYIRLTRDGYVELGEDGNPVKEEDKAKYEKGIVITPKLEEDPENPGKGRYLPGSNVCVLDKEIEWCEFDKAPEYKASEDTSKVVLPDGYSLNIPTYTSEGSSGRLKPSTTNTFDITIDNTINGTYKYGKINLIKTLQGADDYESDIEKIAFNFHVTVTQRVKAIDASGNEIEKPTDVKYFDEEIKVYPTKEGDTWTWQWDSKEQGIVFKWDISKGEVAPEFKVEELMDDGGFIVNKIVSEGVFFKRAWIEGEDEVDTPILEGIVKENDEGETLKKSTNIFFENEIGAPHRGYLEITKKVAESYEADEVDDEKIYTFHFKVKITASEKFEYNGTPYDAGEYYLDSVKGLVKKADANNNTYVAIEASKKEIGVWKSGLFRWSVKAKSPDYEVTELDLPDTDTDEGKEYEIENGSGSLVDIQGDAVRVICTNGPTVRYGDIKIRKSLDIDETTLSKFQKKYLDKRVDELKFKFEVKYNGQTHTVEIDKANRVGNTYTWEKTIEHIKINESNKDFTVKEIDVPAGTHFVKFDGSNPDEYKGILEADTVVEVDNCFNKIDIPNSSLEIVKKVDPSYEIDETKTFKFTVKITATSEFGYDGEVKEPGTYYLDNNGSIEGGENATVSIQASKTSNGSWKSKKFEWDPLKTAPLYEVIEQDLSETETDESKEHKMENAANVLKDEPVAKVICVNKGTDNGSIKIIKTLDIDETLSDELKEKLKERADGYVFTFDVTYNGGTNTVTLDKTNRIGNTYTWEKTIKDITITDDKVFTVKEVDVPEGTYFVKFDGSDSDVYTGTLEVDKVVEVGNCHNKIKDEPVPDKGNLKIVKELTSDSLKNQKFRFKVTINGTFEYNGESYVNEDMVIDDVWLVEGNNFEYYLSDITWKKGMTEPTYKVEEVNLDGTSLTTDDNGDVVVKDKKDGTVIAKQRSITNAGGSLTMNTTTTVTATNDSVPKFGYLKVSKLAENGSEIDGDEEFTFKVTITYADGHSEVYNPIVKVNEDWTKKIEWKSGENAPTYKVEEINIPEGYQLVEISDNATGVVEDASKESDPIAKAITVVAINKSEEHKGKFKIRKQIVAERKLIGDPSDLAFEVTYKIYGTKFKYKGKLYDNEYNSTKDEKDALTFKVTLDGDDYCGVFESDEITWYGNEAPQVEVYEDLSKKDANIGWKNTSISNNGQTLVDSKLGDPLEITVINELPKYKKLILTVNLSGTVWLDETPWDKNGTGKNGKLDSGEEGVEKVEVYVKNSADGSPADLRDEMGEEITQPIYTDKDGSWKAEGITLYELAYEKYKVDFLYNGQKYEPTTYLASAKVGDVSNPYQKKSDMYISDLNNSSINEYPDMVAKYANDSVAIDKNRKEVNERFETIEGKEVLNESGITIGNASGYDLTYEARNMDSSNRNDNSSNSLKSIIKTDDNGYTYDQYKVTATTYIGMESAHAAYPLSNQVHLRADSPSREMTVDGVKVTYKYLGYSKHINLGLINRPDVDVSVVKVLDSATVVTKQNAQFFQFNKLADLIDKTKVERTLAPIGLYSSDYYYRSEIYSMSSDYDKIKEILGENIENSEMQVYLKYKIQIVNNSAEYDVRINGIDDYSDSTLEVVERSFTQDVKTVNGKEENRSISIEKPYITKGISNVKQDDLVWNNANVVQKDILSSDGKYYDKYRVNLPDSPNPSTSGDDVAKLSSGDFINIYVTYKTEKSSVESVINAIKTGTKSNIVEIASYSTYYNSRSFNSNNKEYSGTAGKIDGNSAPSNLNIHDFNFRSLYEDDTYAAPVLELKIDENQNKVVSGLAWEDSKEEGKSVGNGLYDENDEALIGGLTMELVETFSDGTNDYDFLWPTNVGLNSFGGMTVEDVVGFDSTTESSRVNKDKDGKVIESYDSAVVKVGQYNFKKIPVGDYFVKSEYGIDKSTLADTDQNTGAPTALNKKGEMFNAAKSRDGGNQISTEVLTANYDKDANNETPAVYNGQDYKATIFMNKDTDGYIYNDKKENVVVNIPGESAENSKKSYAIDDEVQRLEGMAKSTTITNELSEMFNEANYVNGYHSELYDGYAMSTYTRKVGICPVYNGDESERKEEVKYINTGLIERPKNNIILDKEIKDIEITTNDGKTIFDAEFGTEYTIGDSKDSDAKVLIKLPNSEEYLIANTTLVKDRSVGDELMKAIEKVEDKDQSYNGRIREDEGKYNNGIQNFRFVDIDDEILQGTTITINYRFTALNAGEVDYTTERIAAIDDVKSGETLYDVIADARKDNIRGKEGKYLGSYYYDGQYNDKTKETLRIVTTRVRQIVDYVDNDAVFDTTNNRRVDHSWKNTSVLELAGNGLNGEQLLSKDIVATNKLLDKDDRVYISDSGNNVVLSVDELSVVRNENGIDNYDQLSNALFEQQLVPMTGDTLEQGTITTYNMSEPAEGVGDTTANYTVLDITITKVVASSKDANNLSFDNIAEVVKMENTVGRRDITITQGNTNPKYGEFEQSVAERDTSSTELITFSPPNGLTDKEGKIISQALVVIAAGLVIVGAGVVIIKKKVLTK